MLGFIFGLFFRNINCPHGQCSFRVKKGFMGYLPGIKCPNCENEALAHQREDKVFECAMCSSRWSMIPCPCCGTGISGSQGCYVATCVYGSYDCPEVWVLRKYRDSVLAKSWFGRKFISFYYAVGPMFVDLFGKQKWFHKLFKYCIDAIVAKLKATGIDDSPYNGG